mmetsp:Transcript_18447/g.19911  ORF Transcript_18447/g.19911 Transcript_18447/m.19911 type:complete len:103 (-) Transcript_18447:116-424(-)
MLTPKEARALEEVIQIPIVSGWVPIRLQKIPIPHWAKMDPMVSVKVPKKAYEKNKRLFDFEYSMCVCCCVGNVTSIAFLVFFMDAERERRKKKRKKKNVGTG